VHRAAAGDEDGDACEEPRGCAAAVGTGDRAVSVASPAAPPVPLAGTPASAIDRRWLWAACGSTAAAGVLHGFAAVDHLAAGELVIAFFLVTALGQLAAAVGLAIGAVTGQRPPAALLAGLLAVTVGLLALYLVAHTTDLLAGLTAVDADGIVGGHAHTDGLGPVALGDTPPVHRDPAGFLGTATVTVEVLSVLAFVALLPARHRRIAGDALAVLGAAAWVLWLTGVLG